MALIKKTKIQKARRLVVEQNVNCGKLKNIIFYDLQITKEIWIFANSL